MNQERSVYLSDQASYTFSFAARATQELLFCFTARARPATQDCVCHLCHLRHHREVGVGRETGSRPGLLGSSLLTGETFAAAGQVRKVKQRGVQGQFTNIFLGSWLSILASCWQASLGAHRRQRWLFESDRLKFDWGILRTGISQQTSSRSCQDSRICTG